MVIALVSVLFLFLKRTIETKIFAPNVDPRPVRVVDLSHFGANFLHLQLLLIR